VLSVALAELHDVHAAEDVAQDTLLRAFRRLAGLRDGARFGPWLMQIARRQVVEAVRARRLPAVVPADQPAYDAAADTTIPMWIENEHLLTLVGRLPDHERVLVGLRFFDGHSLAEVATITGRPLGTVTKQLSRAIARLRAWSEKENGR
jgi:RNA polymerase sigma-70 factor (ECF subfamily)